MSMIITTKDLCRDFKVGSEVVKALSKVSIEIESGKLTVLRGRSGSGKTTLINLIGALDKPTSGSIVFDGRELTELSETECDEVRRTEIGFVFQSVALISNMNAMENIDFSLRIAGYPREEREARVAECLGMVKLSERMTHMPSQLSGGEQQRVAIARAFAHRPKVLIADEPTAELDTKTSLEIVGILKQIIAENGTTVIMTTHDPGMMELADKVYTLEDGEVVHD